MVLTDADVAERPLLVQNTNGEEEIYKKDGWWSRLFDLEEAKNQIIFAIPMILTNAFYYTIPIVSVMFAGHLGDLQLAGATLATSWCVVTGIAFMIGLSGALETLCGQGFGAQHYRMLGIYLQAASIITIICGILISTIWFFSEPILISFHQDPQIAKAAALYLKHLIPGLFAYGLLQNILRFLQTQSVVVPLIFLSGIPACFHIGFAYVLVNWTSLGYIGAPISVSISQWISVFILIFHVIRDEKFKHTWQGFSLECFHYIVPELKLALPSAAMVCLEYCAFEILVLLAGLMPNSELSTSLIAMCVNTEGAAYMSAYGLSAAVSTRVSNELGAKNPERARRAMIETLKISLMFAALIILVLIFGHNIWAGTFTSSSSVIRAFASLTPFLVASITLDSFQAILSGVVRGCGWQNLTVIVNLATFYLIGMPIAITLGFKFHFYTKGLWVGLVCGLFCQTTTLLVITLCTEWSRIAVMSTADTGYGNGDLA